MTPSTGDDRTREQLDAVERQMRERRDQEREPGESREGERELVDAVGEEQREARERVDDER